MDYNSFLNIPSDSYFGLKAGFFGLIGLLVVWDMVWKAYGMWTAARNNRVWWFVAILIFNTIGILPILYIYVFSKKGPSQPQEPQK